jgi:hypothetical protein
MKYFFARMTNDGRLGPPINPGYETREAAVADALKLLSLRGANRIVLLEVTESVEVQAKLKFAKWAIFANARD